jgi:hypothetical protein
MAADIVPFSCNYLANIPEIVDHGMKAGCPRLLSCLAAQRRSPPPPDRSPGQGDDCVLKGEGEAAVPHSSASASSGRDVTAVPARSPRRPGDRRRCCRFTDDLMPARDLLRHRRQYFWHARPMRLDRVLAGCRGIVPLQRLTFLPRGYRVVSPQRIVEIPSIREPGLIVDDVAVRSGRHGMEIAEVSRARIRKKYYLETRGDVLLRNGMYFAGENSLEYMFIGLRRSTKRGSASPSGSRSAAISALGMPARSGS